MNNTTRWSNTAIRDKADSLRKQHNMLAPLSLENLAFLAKKLGFETYSFSPKETISNVLGAVFYKENTIAINKDRDDRDKLFTMAHEIGHVVLHSDKDKDRRIDLRKPPEKRNDLSEDEKLDEREADVFSYELILPVEDFIKIYVRFNKDIELVANYFGVTPDMVEERLDFLSRQKKDKFLPKYLANLI